MRLRAERAASFQRLQASKVYPEDCHRMWLLWVIRWKQRLLRDAQRLHIGVCRADRVCFLERAQEPFDLGEFLLELIRIGARIRHLLRKAGVAREPPPERP